MAHVGRSDPWWRATTWNPEADRRIPGVLADALVDPLEFGEVKVGWLREVAQWYLGRMLDGGGRWSKARAAFEQLRRLDDYLAHHEPDPLWAPARTPGTPGLLTRYGAFLQEAAELEGASAAARSRTRRAVALADEVFCTAYAHRDDTALPPGWAALGAVDLPESVSSRRLTRSVGLLDAARLPQVFGRLDVLARRSRKRGEPDGQVVRIVMLWGVCRLLMSEIVGLTWDEAAGLAARFPSAAQDINMILAAQWSWLEDRSIDLGLVDHPSWVFIAPVGASLARRYPDSTLARRLQRFSDAIDLRDADGAPVAFRQPRRLGPGPQKTLQDLGVPAEVLARWAPPAASATPPGPAAALKR